MKMNQISQNYKKLKKPWLHGTTSSGSWTCARKLCLRCTNNREWKLWLTKTELDKLSRLLEVKNSAKRRAWHLLKKAYYSGITQGHRRDLVALSMLYHASLEMENALELKELCTKAGVGRKKLHRTYTRLRNKLGLKLVYLKPEHLLQKYGSRTGAPQEEIETARRILKNGAFKYLSPSVAAAASLHIAMGYKGVNEKFARNCNTNGPSIRNALRHYGAGGKRRIKFCCLSLESPDTSTTTANQSGLRPSRPRPPLAPAALATAMSLNTLNKDKLSFTITMIILAIISHHEYQRMREGGKK